MRYVFGFLCVCALGVMPLVGCSETTGNGGGGGTAGDGGSGGDAGSGGTAGDGGSGGTVRDYAWGVAQSIGGEGYPDSYSLAVNAEGVALVAWAGGAEGTLWVTQYVPGSGWDTSEQIEGGGLGSTTPAVAIAPNGRAVLVWQEYANPEEIRASHYTPSGGWTAAVKISPQTAGPGSQGSAYAPHVAMDGDGNAIAAWPQFDSEANRVVLAARFSSSGQWEEAQAIDDGTADYDSSPDVAMDPTGNAVTVWSGNDGQGGRIFASSYVSRDGWTDARRINSPTNVGTAYRPDADIDAGGNAVAVWVQADYEGDVWTDRVWSNRFTQDGGWGTAESFETTDSSYPEDPHVSVNAGGVAMAIWQRIETGGARYTIRSARYDPANGWEPQTQVDTDRGDQDYGYDPQVAVDPFGDALAVWQGGSADPHVWSSHQIQGEGWQPSVRLDSASNAQLPLVGVDAEGKGTAVWYQGGAPGEGLWANRYSDEATADARTAAEMVAE